MDKKEDIEIVEEEETQKEQKEILKQSNISLILDSYDDIFSSFDARPYSEKALSVDFLAECKNAVRDKGEFEIEMRLLMPKDKRNLKDEPTIKKRLKSHFGKHFLEKEREIVKVKKEGFIWVLIGAMILLGIILVSFKFTEELFASFIALLEVPSWFLMWEGMAKIFIDTRKMEPDFIFYKKMANMMINFFEY
jgi:predicted nucleic acid-binding Zn ribbon protein